MKNLLIVLLLFISSFSFYGQNRFEQIDLHAKNTPASATGSLESLTRYLITPAQNDTEKARSIYIWIVHNIKYDTNALTGFIYNDQSINNDRFTPEQILRTRKAVCGGYSKLFETMCRIAGIEAITILGNIKNIDAFFGERATGETFGSGPNHAWNMMKINNQWYPVECTTGAVWGIAELPEQNIRVYNQGIIDYFFMTPPDKLIETHRPTEVRWQLLNPPISLEQFSNTPYLFPGYFIYQMRLISPNQYTISAERSAEIIIETPITDIFIVAVSYFESTTKPDGTPNTYDTFYFDRIANSMTIQKAIINFNRPGKHIIIIAGSKRTESGWESMPLIMFECLAR